MVCGSVKEKWKKRTREESQEEDKVIGWKWEREKGAAWEWEYEQEWAIKRQTVRVWRQQPLLGSHQGWIHLHPLAFVSWGSSNMSRITAISAYYPSCLSAGWSCSHALASGKLNSPPWAEGQRGRSGRMRGKDRGKHKGFGPRQGLSDQAQGWMQTYRDVGKSKLDVSATVNFISKKYHRKFT